MSEVTNNNYQTNNESHLDGAVSYVKVFGYMAIGLLITAVVALGLGAIFYYTGVSINVMNTIIIIAAIAQLILSLVVSFVFLKGEYSIKVPALLYCITMGFLLSSFVLYLPWSVLGAAFGITALVFGLMCLIVFLTKANFSIFGTLGIGLLAGCGIIALVNVILMLCGTPNMTLYWIVSYAVFAAVLLITMYDIYNIKRIVEAGNMTENLALYCAFTIYVDFIMILLKICYFLAIAYSRR